MDTKKLRQKILDLAIRGKLVPQDPNDEPASVLLERIKAEKERLIKEGKIKRSKKSASDTSHYENWPFEIPESWEWAQLKDIAFIGTGSTPKTTNQEYYGGNIPWINSSSTKHEYVEVPNSYITEKALKETNCQLYPIGTIVIAMYGEGKTRGQVCELAIASTTNQACAAIIPFDSAIKAYIKAFLKGNYYAIRTLAEGGLQPNLNIGKISDFWIPLPPEREQKRIISEVNKWLSIIDKIENEQSDIFSVIQKTKIKVLDLAIHGNLVPQNPIDEPASKLLKRINPTIQIPCDNPHYPFDIPKSWCWVYGSQVFAPMQSCTPNGETFKYIDIDTIDNKNNNILSAKILPTKDAPSRASRFTMKDDTLFSMVRPYLRNIAMVKEDDCIASTGFYVCRSNGSLLAKYCFYMMLSSYVVDGLNIFMKGDNSPSINRSHIESFIYPLPPLAEQKRIVSEIDRYFNALDRIKESLTA